MQTRSSFRNVQSREIASEVCKNSCSRTTPRYGAIVLCILAMERSTGAVTRLSDAVEGEAGPVLATTQAVTPRIRCR